jgi:hypothetical protein
MPLYYSEGTAAGFSEKGGIHLVHGFANTMTYSLETEIPRLRFATLGMTALLLSSRAKSRDLMSIANTLANL